MKPFNPWSPEELAILRDAYVRGDGLPDARRMLPSRSSEAIIAKAERLALFGRQKRLPNWTPSELRILAETFPNGGHKATHIALPDRTEDAIRKAAQKYGIRKGLNAPPTQLFHKPVGGKNQCDQTGCAQAYVYMKDLHRHRREKHGILRDSGRKKRVADALSRRQAERIRRFAVRGRNVNSADLWHILIERGILGPIARAS